MAIKDLSGGTPPVNQIQHIYTQADVTVTDIGIDSVNMNNCIVLCRSNNRMNNEDNQAMAKLLDDNTVRIQSKYQGWYTRASVCIIEFNGVKSKQFISIGWGDWGDYYDLDIEQVKPEKCIVNIQSEYWEEDNGNEQPMAKFTGELINDGTQLRIRQGSSLNGDYELGWIELLEFY